MTIISDISDVLKNVDWNFSDSSKGDSIHSIHPYPAKFIPEIPRTLIKELGIPKGTVVLDPFCGSGVTLVEAQRAGLESIGIDLNPIACLISEVKTKPVPEDLPNLAQKIINEAKKNQRKNAVPEIPNLNHWFETNIQEVITELVTAIDALSNGQSKKALRLALSSIIVRVSNQDSDTRYAAVEKAVSKDDVYKFFLSAAQKLWVVRQPSLFTYSKAEIINRNILEVHQKDIKKPVGLVITSPPYPNAYEYWLYHKYRMFWLGYDPQQVKEHEIGARAHYFKKNHATVEDFVTQMTYVFKLLKGVVVQGGHICFVIGRSKIHGKIVDNASLLASIAEGMGMQILGTFERQIASSRKSFNLSHANIKTEHVLIVRVHSK